MKPLLLILLSQYFFTDLYAQTPYAIDTANISKDSNGVKRLSSAARMTAFINPDEGRLIAEKAIQLADEIGFKKGKAEALQWYGYTFAFSGDYPSALKVLFEGLQIYREINDSFGIATMMGNIGVFYNQLQQYRVALGYLKPAAHYFETLKGTYRGSFEFATIADVYLPLKMNDSALYYGHKALALYVDGPSYSHLKQYLLRSVGNVCAQNKKIDSALFFYWQSIFTSVRMDDKLNVTKTQVKIADLYKNIHQYDSALWYAKAAFDNAQSISAKLDKLDASDLLATLYLHQQKNDSALRYFMVASALKATLYGPDKVRQFQLLALDEQQKQQYLLQQQEQYKNKIKYIILLSVIVVFLLLSFILYRGNKHKQQANWLLQQQKNQIESTLSKLKAAQAQLIQSEKMASLGELTAGIAHEIQNQLNFVNNFSEVNNELIDELQSELQKGNSEEAFAISNDIKNKEQKINHHGKRADAIVKGMLQHSQKTSGQKELTDINALCDEYLRLSYHGLRVKDKNFNAAIQTDFDDSIDKINIIPQDIGRVLLNLYNNAFYATNAKQKTADENYKPVVSVQTKKISDKVEIKVSDNGNGIPQNIVDKIFQPFFTTKPTGEGTGLGLSLSYDIIKAHGGDIKVESEEGESSEFIILLPLKESI